MFQLGVCTTHRQTAYMYVWFSSFQILPLLVVAQIITSRLVLTSTRLSSYLAVHLNFHLLNRIFLVQRSWLMMTRVFARQPSRRCTRSPRFHSDCSQSASNTQVLTINMTFPCRPIHPSYRESG